MTTLPFLLAALILLLGAIAVIRSHGEDVAGWGVLVIGVLLVFFR